MPPQWPNISAPLTILADLASISLASSPPVPDLAVVSLRLCSWVVEFQDDRVMDDEVDGRRGRHAVSQDVPQSGPGDVDALAFTE